MADLVGGHTGQPQPHPRLRTEFGYLATSAIGATATAALFTFDHTTHLDMLPGVYAVTAALCGIGACGWIVRVGDLRRRREFELGAAELRAGQAELRAGQERTLAALADLAGAVEQLRRAVARQSAVRVVGACPPPGRTYRSAGAVGDTVPLQPRVESRRSGGRSDYWTVYSDVMDDLAGIERDPPSES